MQKKSISLSSTIAVALLAMAGTSIAGSQLTNSCVGPLASAEDNPYEATVKKAIGGFSTTTQEYPSSEAMYLSAYMERPNGNLHPAFSSKEQQMVIFKMPSGKYVVRLIEVPPDYYWPGPY